MKKVLIAGILGVFGLGMVSCGHGSGCDAYGGSQADYTKSKVEHTQKIEMIQDLAEATK